jgi:outer membrane protein assembly factor BamB
MAQAENWPNWRGPFYDGSTTETNLPDHWSKTENTKWIAPLPGRSGSTPIIWNDSVFVTSPDHAGNLLLVSIDTASGKTRWQKTVGSGNDVAAKNNMTGPSPATDGKRVVALYGTGEVAAFDFAGTQLWSENVCNKYGKFAIKFFYSSSPVLYHDKVYIQAMQQKLAKTYEHAVDGKPTRDSYLLCLDAQTGHELWRRIRSTDAVEESLDAYTSPIVYEGPHGGEIILFGAGFVTSHNPETGEENWRCGSLNPKRTWQWRTIASPVAGDGMVFAAEPRAKSPLFAINTGGHGLIPPTEAAWKYIGSTTDVPTPLFYQHKLYVLNGSRKEMTCIDPKTGAIVWQGNLNVSDVFTASPTASDGKIYCISEGGSVVVLSAGRPFKVISSFTMEGEGAAGKDGGVPPPAASDDSAPILSSIAIADGRLYIRTPRRLYSVGK